MKLSKSSSFSNPVVWATFFSYLFLSGYTIMHHEMWVDELHSWNIAKGSGSFFDLISNTKYEGHPPVWYIILWAISKFTHDLFYVQLLHVCIASAVVFIVLFYSPFSLSTRLLIPFGYYFLFEYAVLSRNYAIGLLLILCVCVMLRRDRKNMYWLYYLILFFASNTHLIVLLLAVSIHLYFLMRLSQSARRLNFAFHILLGIIVFLPAVYFIIPPSDSQLSFSFFMQRWNIHQLTSVGQLPLRAFIPIPAFWDEHPWNTELLLDGKLELPILKFINPLIALASLALFVIVLKKNKRALIVFLVNVIFSAVVNVFFFPLTSERYSGFIFIGFLTAYWLYRYESSEDLLSKKIVNTILALQIIAGFFFVAEDIRRPFSNAYKIREIENNIQPNEKVVTDYWAMNIISAYIDKPVYCVDLQKEKSFVFWGPEMVNALKNPHRYFDGILNFMNKEKISKIYFLSTNTLDVLKNYDSKLSLFDIKIIEASENTIKKGSDLYLYEVAFKGIQ